MYVALMEICTDSTTAMVLEFMEQIQTILEKYTIENSALNKITFMPERVAIPQFKASLPL